MDTATQDRITDVAGAPGFQIKRHLVGHWLRDVTGLPVDFQIQRQTEANAAHKGIRSALGMKQSTYAGGGDATDFRVSQDKAQQ